MTELTDILRRGHHSLVVGNGEVRTFDGRGIADLYRLLTEGNGFLQGASVADKVVGKGAAALMVLGGVREVYAEIISTAALGLLRAAGTAVRFGREVPHIINRAGNGICPVEQLCRECATAAECLPPITEFMQQHTQQSCRQQQ